jgi:hypothetical protein
MSRPVSRLISERRGRGCGSIWMQKLFFMRAALFDEDHTLPLCEIPPRSNYRVDLPT